MARGVNKVIIVGTNGGSPEVKYLESGTAVAVVSLATSEQWKDKQTGEKKEATEWHKVKFWGRLAEIVGEYVTKGQLIYIEGSLKTDKYKDKDGNDRYSTYVLAKEMQMLGGKKDGESKPSTRKPDKSQDPPVDFDEDMIPF